MGIPTRKQNLDTSSDDKIDPKDLIAMLSVEDFNFYANEYYKKLEKPEALLGKPFSDPLETPKHLVRLGLMMENLNLAPGVKVLDFGCGTGWISKFIWQMGCDIIGIDVSEEALRLARILFGKYPIPKSRESSWDFRLFDGCKLPVKDGKIDRIVCYDTFHHVPNQKTVIDEFYRVLTNRGTIVLSEPIGAHSKSESSQAEMRQHKVLENDLDLAEVKELFEYAGFSGPKLKVATMPELLIDFQEWKRIVKKRRVKPVSSSMGIFARLAAIMYFQKGDTLLDSRFADGLICSLKVEKRQLQIKKDVTFWLDIEIKNTGSNLWLCGPEGSIGTVAIGIQELDLETREIKAERGRVGLEKDALSGEILKMRIPINLKEIGRHQLRIDLVSEHVCWFHERGSEPIILDVDVTE